MADGIDDYFSGIKNATGEAAKFRDETKSKLEGFRGEIAKPINSVKDNIKGVAAKIKAAESKVRGTINEYKDEVIENLDSIVTKLSGGLLDYEQVAKYVKVGKHGVEFDSQGFATQVGDKIGLDLSTPTSLVYQMTRMANTEFQDVTNGVFGNLVDTDGKNIRITKSWKDQLGSGLLSSIAKATGSSRAMDLSIDLAYRNSLLKMSAMYGMSDSYEKQLNAYLSKEAGKLALINAVQYMINNGDIISIDAVLNLIDKEQYGWINAKYPDMIPTIFANFQIDSNMVVADYPALKAKLMRVLNSVIDDTWYYRETQFGKAINLAIVNQISDDMKKILMSDPTYPEVTLMIACAGVFSDEPAFEVFKRHFPRVPIIIQ